MGLRSQVGEVAGPVGLDPENESADFFSGQQDTDISDEELEQLISVSQAPEVEQPAQEEQFRAPAQTADELDSFLDEEFAAPGGDDIDSFLNEEFGEAPVNGDLVNQVKSVLDERGFFSKLADRAGAGFGRTPTEKKSFLEKRLGVGNVKIKDGEVMVRGNKDEPFKPFDPDEEGFDGFGEAALDVADFSGDLVEGVIAGLIEVGAITGAAGTAAGTAGLGTPAALGIAVGGAAVGGAAGGLARSALLKSVGGEVDPEEENFQSILKDAGLGVAGLGLGAAAGKAVTGVAGTVKNFLAGVSPKKAIEINALAREAVENFKPVGVKSVNEGGESVFSAVERNHKALSEEIGLFKGEAKNRVKGQKFEPIIYEEKLKDILEKENVAFDEFGRASRQPETTNLGVADGAEIVDDLIGKYNGLQDTNAATGGLTIDQLFDQASSMGDRVFGRIADKRHDNGARVLKELSNALTSDKTEVMFGALKGTEFEGKVAPAMRKYSNTIDEVRQLRKLWRTSQESGEQFVEGLIRPGNLTQVKKMKDILGETSDDWGELKSTYLTKKIEESVSPTTGIFDPKKLLKKVDNLGSDLKSEMLSKGQFNRLRNLSREFEGMKLGDIDNSPQVQRKLQDAILVTMPFVFPTARAAAAFRLTKGHAKAADYLTDEGWRKVAERAKSGKEKAVALEARNIFQKLVENSKRSTIGDRKVLIETPVVRNILRTTLQDGSLRGPTEDRLGEIEQEDQDLQDFLNEEF